MLESSGPQGESGGCCLVGPTGEAIPLPESVYHVLERAAAALARGDSVTLVPVAQQLTTQQAADMLGVSRQYLIRLLDNGKLPFTKVGRQRRLRLDDVVAFKAEREGAASEPDR